ncbi:MAG: phosphoglycerate kinase, partial [Dehalococcoidia bacterium]|nr:phosphoglycerate kinase [Dehalococcoidia bacterium]
LIGGGMACTFMKARGYDIGQSLVEEKSLPLAYSLLKRAASNRVKLVLPVDVVVAESISNKADTRIITPDEIQPNWHIVDIGPKSIEIFSAELKRAKTVIWNGPVGILEIPNFSNGTEKIVTLLAQSKATTIICGGSTTEAVQSMGLANKMSHVSTGGGAALKFLAGETLPAVEALLDK